MIREAGVEDDRKRRVRTFFLSEVALAIGKREERATTIMD
jgi:hypothetical protein